MTTLPKSVAAIFRAVQWENVDLIRDLERESQTLDRIADSFDQILDRRTFSVSSFEEELSMAGGRKVWRRWHNLIVSLRFLERDHQVLGPNERRIP